MTTKNNENSIKINKKHLLTLDAFINDFKN